jgi:hypothetical protein
MDYRKLDIYESKLFHFALILSQIIWRATDLKIDSTEKKHMKKDDTYFWERVHAQNLS